MSPMTEKIFYYYSRVATSDKIINSYYARDKRVATSDIILSYYARDKRCLESLPVFKSKLVNESLANVASASLVISVLSKDA